MGPFKDMKKEMRMVEKKKLIENVKRFSVNGQTLIAPFYPKESLNTYTTNIKFFF